MNKKDLMKVGVGIGVLALLYFVFKKKGTTAKSINVSETNPLANNIDKAITADIKDKTTIKAGDSSKDVTIKKFFADMMANPPKSEQEAMARATKFGLTKADIDAYNAKQMNQFSSFVGDDGSKKRESLRRQYGLSFEDDKKLSRVIRLTNGILNQDGITNPQEREAIINERLRASAESQNLNLRAFYLVEAAMQAVIGQLIQRKKSFAGFLDLDAQDIQGQMM
jgi:DNA-binding helix-hairpin-helix protein with protein kinase domain